MNSTICCPSSHFIIIVTILLVVIDASKKTFKTWVFSDKHGINVSYDFHATVGLQMHLTFLMSQGLISYACWSGTW